MEKYKKNLLPVLSMQEKLIVGVKSVLKYFPFGIGSAIIEGYFGSIDKRRIKKIENFLEDLSVDFDKLSKNAIDANYFHTEEFAYLFEAVLKKVSLEVQQKKLEALRAALFNIIAFPNKIGFDKKNHFLKAIDSFETTHIEVLKVLSGRASERKYLIVKDICVIMNAKNESDRNFIYSALDSLANKEFIVSGPVPFDSNGGINKSAQGFVCTSLGMEFLDFICNKS